MLGPVVLGLALAAAHPAEEDHNRTACPTAGHQLPGPAAGCSDAARASWLAGMKACRASALEGIGYAGGVYGTARVAWTQQAFAVPMIASFDREIYDDSREYAPGEHGWTVDKFLAGTTERYGGADAVLLWPTYENIGLDDRSQVALYKALPGGFEGMTNLTDQLHARGVKVLWAYNPWDTGTRGSAGLATGARAPDHAAVLMKFVELLNATHADGINGDTMSFVPQDWWNDSVKVGRPLALEPEGGGTYPALNWETMSVCHCGYKPGLQTVDHYKWLDARFQTSVRDRWAHDHTDALQFCVFNGVGFETTENDWGTWNEFTARDKAAMKRIFTLLRFFGKRELLTSPEWVPHVAGCLQRGVFASLFPRGGESLYTLVNRGGNSTNGAQLKLPPATLTAASIVYDCWRGEKLEPSADGTLSFPMETEGYGCVLVTTQAKASAELNEYLSAMKAFTAEGALNSFSKEFQFLQQKMLPHPRTPRAAAAAPVPAGMVVVPAAAHFDYDVTAQLDQGSDSQLYWENPQVTSKDPNSPAANAFKAHSMRLPIEGFLMDKYPVTTAEYGVYLSSSQYRPVDGYNFLRNWNGSRLPPPSIARKPVTYVGFKEAEAYCHHAGKRLPHDWEFQYAGQGLDGRTFPWGNDNCSECTPKQVTATQIPGAPDVGSRSPQGDSPFGVADMVGTVWQYTTSFVDAHDRNVLTRGSSNYRPGIDGRAGSHWYFPDAPQLDQHEKMKMMSNSYERAGTLGFRCVKDIGRATSLQSTGDPQSKPCSGKVCGRWSGPPMAFTTLSHGDTSRDWARFYPLGGGVLEARSEGPMAHVIGSLRPLCAVSLSVWPLICQSPASTKLPVFQGSDWDYVVPNCRRGPRQQKRPGARFRT
jgi:formylglycine-generating enzyme required for sulfatase activity